MKPGWVCIFCSCCSCKPRVVITPPLRSDRDGLRCWLNYHGRGLRADRLDSDAACASIVGVLAQRVLQSLTQYGLVFRPKRAVALRKLGLCPTIQNKEGLAVEIVRRPIGSDVTAMPPDRADLHPAHCLPDILPIGDFSLRDHRLAVGRHHCTRNWRTLPKNF